MLATPMSAPRPLSNQRLKLHRLFPVLNGYGGVRIQGVWLKGSEAVEEATSLNDVKPHSIVGRVNTQDNVISRDNISQCGSWISGTFNECTNVCCEVTQFVKTVHGVLQRN
jgi:hypothetical protein